VEIGGLNVKAERSKYHFFYINNIQWNFYATLLKDTLWHTWM